MTEATSAQTAGFLRRCTDILVGLYRRRVARSRARDARVISREEIAAAHLESVMRRTYLALGTPLPRRRSCKVVCRLDAAPLIQEGMWSSDERCLDCGERRWWPS